MSLVVHAVSYRRVLKICVPNLLRNSVIFFISSETCSIHSRCIQSFCTGARLLILSSWGGVGSTRFCCTRACAGASLLDLLLEECLLLFLEPLLLFFLGASDIGLVFSVLLVSKQKREQDKNEPWCKPDGWE